MKLQNILIRFAIVLVSCLFPTYAWGYSFLLSKVMDSNTPIPGGVGKFTSFISGNPLIGGSSVVFRSGIVGQEGIYCYNGSSLKVVADQNTPIPSGVGSFTRLDHNPVISNNIVSFEASGTNQQGFYLYDGATLSKVVDLNNSIPEGSGNFEGFSNLTGQFISGNNVAFVGHGSVGYGVYVNNGATIIRVADYNTPIPSGTGNFNSFCNYLDISGNNIVFCGGGSDLRPGYYFFNGTTLSKVADHNTQIPQGSGNFIDVNVEMISGANVLLQGLGTGGQEGLYLYNNGILKKVADLNTPIPEGSGNFIEFFNPRIDGANVIFLGYGSNGQSGIYLYSGNTLRKIVDLNTPIPSGSGNFSVIMGPNISGASIVFTGIGPNGQNGIYLFRGSSLNKVVDHNTQIPEGVGNFTGVGADGISGDYIVFEGHGTNQFGYYLVHIQNSNFAVPTLSEWSAIILALLLGLSAFYVLRQKNITR